ncbi:MAG: hypothetical protein Q9174_002614 [Haloplaca sp. 1 TL-2023]
MPGFRSARGLPQALQGIETQAPIPLGLKRSQGTEDGVKEGHEELCKSDGGVEKVDIVPVDEKTKARSTKGTKSRVSPHFAPLEETSSAKVSSARRKKPTKLSRDSDQSQIPRSKITKPRASVRPEKQAVVQSTKQRPEGDTAESNFNAKRKSTSELPALQEHPSAVDLGLPQTAKEGLEQSLMQTSSDCQVPSVEFEAAWTALLPSELPSHPGPHFSAVKTTLDGVGYVEADPSASGVFLSSRGPNGEAVAKRPRLDHAMSEDLTVPQGVAKKKKKAVKKKPQTITEKATAPFVEPVNNPSSLLNYFATPPQIVEPEQPDLAQTGAKGKQNSPGKKSVKAKKAKSKLKDKAKPTVRLLSPGRAMKTANDLDLLFGTSSQLAREESPTFIRDLQRAYRDSEATGSHRPPSQEVESQASFQSIASSTSSIQRSAGFRNLWSIATRDATGSLHNVETIDLVDTPQPRRSYSTDVKSNSVAQAGETMSNIPLLPCPKKSKSADTVDMSEDFLTPVIELHEVSHLLPRSVAEGSLRDRPRSKSPVKKKPGRRKAAASTAALSLPEMPNYNAFTDLQLVNSITAFGFKSSKQSRKGMVELLELCWKSEHQKALRSLPDPDLVPPESANVVASNGTKSKSPAKKRGRPPKTGKEDSKTDTEVACNAIPKKPRGRPKKNAATEPSRSKARSKSPGPEALVEQEPKTKAKPRSKAGKKTCPSSRRQGGASKASDPTKHPTVRVPKLSVEETTAFMPIVTKAVKSQRPTHDAANLSWYEKILLYDPIIIEDLTDWLNEKGLSSVDCEKTISPLAVKQWCESKSICCLWRENLRGGTRARY